jgi:hypothetical protein
MLGIFAKELSTNAVPDPSSAYERFLREVLARLQSDEWTNLLKPAERVATCLVYALGGEADALISGLPRTLKQPADPRLLWLLTAHALSGRRLIVALGLTAPPKKPFRNCCPWQWAAYECMDRVKTIDFVMSWTETRRGLKADVQDR